MGGRGSGFGQRSEPSIENLLEELKGKKKKKSTWTDYGDGNKDFEIIKHTDLTKSLKKDKIVVCNTIINLDGDLAQSNLEQIRKLSSGYSSFTETYLDSKNLRVRSFEVDDVSYKTGKRKPNLTVVAAFNGMTGDICFNERTNKSLKQIREDELSMQADRWAVQTDTKNAEKSTITHEFGHFVEECIVEKRVMRDYVKDDIHAYNKFKNDYIEHDRIMAKESRKIVKEVAEIAVQKYHAKSEDLMPSEYARSGGYEEWFAEAFTEANLHSADKPLIKAMKEFLKREALYD